MASTLEDNNDTDVIILSDEEDNDNSQPMQIDSQTSERKHPISRNNNKGESDENSDANSVSMVEKLLIKDDSDAVKGEAQTVKKQPLSVTNTNAGRKTVNGRSMTANVKTSKISSDDIGENSQQSVEDTKKNSYDSDGKEENYDWEFLTSFF